MKKEGKEGDKAGCGNMGRKEQRRKRKRKGETRMKIEITAGEM